MENFEENKVSKVKMNKCLKTLYDELKNNSDFLILSRTSDPKSDKPETLKNMHSSLV